MKQKMIANVAGLCAAALLLGGFSGCGSTEDDGKLTIVTTVYATYDLTKQLTAALETPCEVRLLLTPGGESHSYEPTPADVAAVQSCDLFIYVGGTSEQWAEKLIASGRGDKPSLRMFDAVTPLAAAHDHDDDHDHHADEYDEHIWTSPLNADAMAAAILAGLGGVTDSSVCQPAYDALHEEFLALDARAKEIHDNESSNTLIFADRFPFLYLTTAYGWEYEAAFSGCSSDTDASAATLSALITTVKDSGADTVFYLENSSQKIADAVCQATGARAVMMQSGNNVSAEDFANGKHIQTILSENLDAIKEALG